MPDVTPKTESGRTDAEKNADGYFMEWVLTHHGISWENIVRVGEIIKAGEREAASAAVAEVLARLTVETLMEWLHDLEGTQHFITHETGYDGDDIEGVECIDGLESHREDAEQLAALIASERGT